MSYIHSIDRRSFLKGLSLGSIPFFLESVATGIPLSWFMNPGRILAEEGSGMKARYLVLSTSMEGDPFLCNGPGSYIHEDMMHPVGLLTENVRLGGLSYKVGSPWKKLEAYFPNMGFFYFSTMLSNHPEELRALRISGATERNEMLVSLLSEHLSLRLGTVQNKPISLGAKAEEILNFRGQPQPNFRPLGIKNILMDRKDIFENLHQLREDSLSKILAYMKDRGNQGRKNYIEKYIQSQTEAKNLGMEILNTISSISGDDIMNQIKTALALIMMKVTPVITIHIDFGADNHIDVDLKNERNKLSSGVDAIAFFINQLINFKLQDEVVFASYNVFGRNMSLSKRKLRGRDHWGDASGGIIYGNRIKGNLYGGLEYNESKKDFVSLPMNAQTGMGDRGGDISTQETFASFAKTLAYAVGVSVADVDKMILKGKCLESVVFRG
jgi:hypothetical protein